MNYKLNEKNKKYKISRSEFLNRLIDYRFNETKDIVNFLKFFCDENIDICDYLFIRAKLELCLKNHDNMSDYFIPLRQVATELDCLIS